MMESRQELKLAYAVAAQGEPPHTEHRQAEWARRLATELRKQGAARSKELAQAKGEAIPPEVEQTYMTPSPFRTRPQ